MKTYIKIYYNENVILNMRVVKLISSFEHISDMLKFILTLTDTNIEKILIKYNKNLIEIDRSDNKPVISFLLDLFDFEKEFEE